MTVLYDEEEAMRAYVESKRYDVKVMFIPSSCYKNR